MRCLSCDASLTDYEATRKSAFSGEYVDLCNHCYNTISEDLHTIDRADLAYDENDEDPNHCGLDVDTDY